MEIRKFRETDCIDDVSRVYARSWKTAYKGIVPQDYLDAIPENRWSPILINEVDHLLLAIDGRDIVGSATYRAAPEELSEGWGELISLYLMPEYWRKGTGTRLLREAEKALYDMGLKKIYLWVLQDNRAAREFYEKNGFHYNGDIVSALIGDKALYEVKYIKTDG